MHLQISKQAAGTARMNKYITERWKRQKKHGVPTCTVERGRMEAETGCNSSENRANVSDLHCHLRPCLDLCCHQGPCLGLRSRVWVDVILPLEAIYMLWFALAPLAVLNSLSIATAGVCSDVGGPCCHPRPCQ